jgi:hypothetical protein
LEAERTAEVEGLRAKLAATEAALRRENEAQVAALEAERAAEVERLQAALDHALAERAIILRSTAWRATAPFRGGLTFLLGRSRPAEG